MLSWFNAREATAFGQESADFLAERLPLEVVEQTKILPRDQKKTLEILQKLYAKADIFKMSYRLNIYKKAKLANKFQWRLLDKGYPKDFVDAATKELLLHL